MMVRVLRFVGWLVVVLLIIGCGVGVWAYTASAAMLSKTYAVPSTAVALPTDAAAVERGKHLVHAVGACATCHDDDLGGKVYAEMGPVGIVAGRNLTRGRGGIGATFSDADWVRAIRYGVRHDG